MITNELGRDFWLYRLGQIVSVIGDSCGSIALSWWILEKTGSAIAMSSVLAPAMALKIVLLPLFGPFGDRYSRKKIIFVSEIWRFLATSLIGLLALLDQFDTTLIAFIFALNAIGSALFSSASASIIPQLVKAEQIQQAMQQSMAIQSIGGIVGGIFGGVMVSLIGIPFAFLVDGGSFFIAGIAALLIKVNTRPERILSNEALHPIKEWSKEIREGFLTTYKLPIMFWFIIICMIMTFVMSPFGVVLPILVKTERNLPAWFLGALESSISIGIILGSLVVGYIAKKIFIDRVFVAAIFMQGIGVLLLPLVPDVYLPLFVMLIIGFFNAMTIPLGSKIILAIPDQYRSRISSIMSFGSQGIAPLGVIFSGVIIATLGVKLSMAIMGGGMAIVSLLIFKVPKFIEFARCSQDETQKFFVEKYPEAFK